MSPITKDILFVDDNASLRHMIANLLRDREYQVHEAKDAQDALRLIKQDPFDVVITDLVLPGSLNGIDILVHHSRLSPGKGRILFTAFPSRQLPKICAYIGARYLPKPASLHELIRVIEDRS
ncbi:MAG: response regulator [Candidatus Binatia bacterium]